MTTEEQKSKIMHTQLQETTQRALHDLGFEEWTSIQEKCIPEIMQGKDIFGQSATGSGKTAAFGIPLIEKITPGRSVQALILTPTRELCVQVADALKSFAKHTKLKIASIYGGVGISPQIDALKRADVVVGTPGRILDHLERGTLQLAWVRFLVLDEADKMFEMGFIDDVRRIIHGIPKDRQTMLFSATLPYSIVKLAETHLRNPVHIKSESYVDRSKLKQTYYEIPSHEKFSLLVHLLKHKTSGLALVFCATRREVDLVANNLKKQGIKALPIHGGLSQKQRLEVLDKLKHEQIRILVATDVAARGLDIKNISHVYNYDVPKTSDEYIHRVGRTARAGESGEAVTLLSDRDYQNFDQVLRDRSLTIKREQPPRTERVMFHRQERPQGRSGFSRGPRRNGHALRDRGGPRRGSGKTIYANVR
ncbi:MAG: DEAD/DEAH box helicase [archaeon]